MVNYHFLKKIMVIGERQSLLNMEKYLSLAIENSNILISMFEKPENNIIEMCKTISTNEKAADEITLLLKRDITSGAIGSSLMDNFLTLIEKFDDIIDKTYWISREMLRAKDSFIANVFHMEPIRGFYENFQKILQLNIQAVGNVNQMLEISDIEQVKTVRNKIQSLEEEVDEIKDGIIDRLYKTSESITYLTFNHINSIVHTLDDLLDNCEDISDLVLNTMLSVSR
jgi:predicted phosphate transport protein (TIGR00153 family)